MTDPEGRRRGYTTGSRGVGSRLSAAGQVSSSPPGQPCPEGSGQHEETPVAAGDPAGVARPHPGPPAITVSPRRYVRGVVMPGNDRAFCAYAISDLHAYVTTSLSDDAALDRLVAIDPGPWEVVRESRYPDVLLWPRTHHNVVFRRVADALRLEAT